MVLGDVIWVGVVCLSWTSISQKFFSSRLWKVLHFRTSSPRFIYLYTEVTGFLPTYYCTYYCIIVLDNWKMSLICHIMFPLSSQHPQCCSPEHFRLSPVCTASCKKGPFKGTKNNKCCINSVFPFCSGLPSSSPDGSTGQTCRCGVSLSERRSEPKNQSWHCCCLLSRHRLASGPDEKIQLSSMVAAFQAVRDLVVSEAS